MMNLPRQLTLAAALYFLLQGVLVFVWWTVIFLYPEIRQYFEFEAAHTPALLAFLPADILFLGFGSLAASWLIFVRSEFGIALSWLVTGAVSYATIYCLAYVFRTDSGWLGVILMITAAVWTGAFTAAMQVGGRMFRKAKKSSTGWIITKTIMQIIVIWSAVLAAIPYLIAAVEAKIGIPQLTFTFQRPIAGTLFVMITLLGVWAAITMSRIGRGTPLPLDHANALVIESPYAYVRNPMAVSGIGQALAVALYLGSPLVAAYALMGSLIWQLIFRPLEEAELTARFGDRYETYRYFVRCWIPRIGRADESVSSVDIDLPHTDQTSNTFTR